MPTFNRAAKWIRRLLGRGANRDVRPELLPDGYYADGINIRPASIIGNDGGIETIGGEREVFINTDGQQGYVCIGSASVNGRVMEFWCHPEPADNPPIVRIDGVIVASSPNIPYTYDRPLQLAVVERCRSGFVYPADHQSPPLFWDVQAMLDGLSSGSSAYFSEYNADFNSVLLAAYPEFPRHRGNPVTGTGAGLPAGQYSYMLRYESLTGDRTNIGPETPLISVARTHDNTWTGTAYPGARTTGGEVNIEAPTQYGIALEFNVDNTQGFAFVEVIRRRFNNGEGLNGPGILEVVGKIAIIPGQFTNIQFVDPVDANFFEDVPQDQEEERQLDIIAPKSVEFADNRLTYANFQTAPLTPEIEFTLNDDVAFVPITKKVTTLVSDVEQNSGYTDPVNDTYLKSYRRGERYGFAIQPWYSKLDKPYAVPIPGTDEGGYQFPNRRDRKTGDSALYSDSPIYAATTDCQATDAVDRTFDAFTQGAKKKDDDTTVINVFPSQGAYNPWHPIDNSDPSVQGHNISPDYGSMLFGNTYQANTAYIWDPQYNALGLAIYGINNIPSNIKAFTVVRTPPAGRVVCQGLGTYKMNWRYPQSGYASATKATDEIHFCSRDLINGMVPQDVIEDMANNPSSYQVQFVSPLGFHTEHYGYDRTTFYPGQGPDEDAIAVGVDMLSYAGIQHDEGQVNVTEPGPGGMAYQSTSGPAPPGNYVGYSAWRNQRPPVAQGPPTDGSTDYSFWNEGTNNGNTPMTMTFFSGVEDGRSRFFQIRVDGFIYSPGTFWANAETTFNNTNVRNFHQPWYVVNIIKVGAEVPGGTGQYLNTGTTIKIESCIGVSDGAAGQAYRLVNERREDVLGYLPTDYRYVYVKEVGLEARAWVCMTNNSTLNPAVVLADIAANGFWVAPDGTQVYGLYNVAIISGETLVQFGLWGAVLIPSPAAEARILVRYDPNAPIRVFGGDMTIASNTLAIVDRPYTTYPGSLGDDSQLAFTGLIPLPYKGFARNPNYLIPSSTTEVNDTFSLELIGGIRQWCVTYDAETPSQNIMDLWVHGRPVTQSNPRGHYVIKPYDLQSGYDGVSYAGFYPQYNADYLGWNSFVAMGGIRFITRDAEYNPDYWKQPNVSSIGVPETRLVDRTDYCTGMIASLERDPELENVPGLRTFIASNMKILSEENGEIKYIASALGPSGRNMYAWTNRGVCRVLTNKNILTGASGEVVSTQSISNYWGDEMWISRSIGAPDQMWRLLSKGYAPTGSGYADSFFWADRNSMYRMTGDSITDIARERYLSQLLQTLKLYPTGYELPSTAFYNKGHNEAWFALDEQVVPSRPPLIPNPVILPKRLFVYSAEKNEWVGQFTYDFDSYVMNGQSALGMRNLQTFLLNDGDLISDQIRVSSVTVPLVGDMGVLKEFTRWAVTGDRPDQIEILDQNYNVICRQNEALAALINPAESQYWVLRYRMGWEQWAAAKNVDASGAIAYTDERPQGEFFYLRCTWNSVGSKQSVSLGGAMQNLK